MTQPRVEPGTLRQLGPFNWAFSRLAARVMGVSDMHIFSTLGRTGGLFRGWLYYSARLMPFGTLSRRDTEMVIIRVAHLRQCEYELAHHLRLGSRAGIDAATAAAIMAPAPGEPHAGPRLTARERTILAAVDELVTRRDIADPTWSRLSQTLRPRQLIGLVMLVGQYDSLATTITTLRIQADR
ncbi:carboxymuconolactone decarboxylase family protein [Williamsia sp. CHRR-6]|uniref:carboxymuconolactone decarboxylase family protein n=1 Tax=Williamsia sp. CHRR-6 TaxID=2835871 RepID=UPI001BD99303|nr:carboxymuconolactone decarboxylase family protein [Williamsia sp. CHRR-6]MBT0566959.1 carboxymuconolactone decarboxylase family protein [Williamsia sp. CHRR-6]